ncbi:MAG TPA: DEAD/DEAH box helicase [Sedimentisphaerales bacterium]|nr:DEAD/DEAH box helicase [Sedimentisphaerales bacterium]HRS09526.1 DEAD/DEAH box helicase [Sedimentisphaerales bacterium]HRV46223.1 DEAD/DEAH box helicase [Sedimentisphaerales bacterium]
MPFKTFGLSDPLVQGILATGYTTPTEIQSQAIPVALEGHDLIGCAQTGTGKTAAFVLPILNRLAHGRNRHKKGVRSLILTPTRELAVQVEQSILCYGRFLHLKSLAIYGGVSIENQLRALRRGVDIVVSTPGRLLDHMQRGSIRFEAIEVLVLDEADRMLDMGFIRDVRRIVDALPTKRQTMLFSATISPEITGLSAGMQKSPRMIQIGRPHNPVQTVTQHVYPVEKSQKIDLLLHMLKNRSMYSVLVFSRTKHGADKITRRLERSGIVSVAIHSGRSQGQRQRALDGFKSGKYQVMVATDIAARGIDVAGISHVVNFDVPAFAEDYIHRIGRTGRASATGDAITFVSQDEKKYLRQIEKFTGRRFRPQECPGFACVPAEPVPEQPKKSPSSDHRTRAFVASRPTAVHAKRGPAWRRRRNARPHSA